MSDNLFENVRQYMNILNNDELRKILSDMSPSELRDLWTSLNSDESRRIFVILPLESKVDLVNELSPPDQERLIKELTTVSTKRIFEEMEPDDLVDIMQTVSPEAREAVWSSLSDEAKRETQFLLRFDEDDAAGLMTPRYAAVRSNITIGQAIHLVRRDAGEVETVYYIYVVDQLKRLLGVVSLRDMLFTDDSERIENVMERNMISVREEMDQEEVARTLEEHDLIALPVVDRYGRLLGIVTFDDIIDVIREEQTEDVYKMGAMDGSTERYMDTSVWRLVRKRIPWLTILLLAGTITTNVLALYESLFIGAAFLIWFVPVITQTGGNSGTQSSTLMIRGIATGEIHFRDFGRILLKEFMVGLLMGLGLAAVIIIRSMFLPPGVEWFQALAIGISLSFVVLFSSLIGAAAPLLIHKLGFDPTVMAGPLMATVIDVAGLTIYFQTARLILNM
jgi:magnesium transporter